MEVFGGVCVVVGLWASDMCAPISLTSPTPKEGYIQSPLERGEGGECPP